MKLQIPTGFYALFFLILLSHSVQAQESGDIIYVAADAVTTAQGNSNFFKMHEYGKSWDTAFRYLHDALRFGDPNATQIWIKKGNYYLDRGFGINDQTNDSPSAIRNYLNPFIINNRTIKIYGGFAGTETSLDERDVENNPTYLDGNVYYKSKTPLPDADNPEGARNIYARRMMVIYKSTVTLDGLTFQYVLGSDSTSSSATEPSAGYGTFIAANLSALTVNNCVFQYGAGGERGIIIYSDNDTGDFVFTNSTVQDTRNSSNLIYRDFQSSYKLRIDKSIFQNLNDVSGTTNNLDIQIATTTGDIQITNSVFYNNIGVSLYQQGFGNVTLDVHNILVADNDLSGALGDNSTDDGFISLLGYNSDNGTEANLTFTNNSFINNIGSSLMNTSSAVTNGTLNLNMHNNLFYNNKTEKDGSTAAKVIELLSSSNSYTTNFTGSHNASDNDNASLSTSSEISQTDGIDLSSVSAATNLFTSPTDADGADDKWFTEDDGFVPVNSSLIHNAGDNNQVSSIHADIKGHTRIQDTTVDVGAYEFGTEAVLNVEGMSTTPALLVYPNPVTAANGSAGKVAYLTNPNEKAEKLILRDMGGRIVKEIEIKDSNKAIDLGGLASGTYLAILTSKTDKYNSFKLVIE